MRYPKMSKKDNQPATVRVTDQNIIKDIKFSPAVSKSPRVYGSPPIITVTA